MNIPMKNNYIVEIEWGEEYHFENADAAMAFAIVASTHRIHDVEEKVPDVRVRIVRKFDYKE